MIKIINNSPELLLSLVLAFLLLLFFFLGWRRRRSVRSFQQDLRERLAKGDADGVIQEIMKD